MTSLSAWSDWPHRRSRQSHFNFS